MKDVSVKKLCTTAGGDVQGFLVLPTPLLGGLVTPRDHGFFSSKNHIIKEMLRFFFANIYYFE